MSHRLDDYQVKRDDKVFDICVCHSGGKTYASISMWQHGKFVWREEIDVDYYRYEKDVNAFLYNK